jgi:hypothetical protein
LRSCYRWGQGIPAGGRLPHTHTVTPVWEWSRLWKWRRFDQALDGIYITGQPDLAFARCLAEPRSLRQARTELLPVGLARWLVAKARTQGTEVTVWATQSSVFLVRPVVSALRALTYRARAKVVDYQRWEHNKIQAGVHSWLLSRPHARAIAQGSGGVRARTSGSHASRRTELSAWLRTDTADRETRAARQPHQRMQSRRMKAVTASDGFSNPRDTRGRCVDADDGARRQQRQRKHELSRGEL